MKKKTRKFGLIVAGVLSSVALGLACASCKEKADPIVLENFEDIEITADLDGSYTLPVGNVTDTKGNDYRVTFEVTTESGKTVNPFNNSFRLKYFEDYYVICTTDLGGGDVRTRTITIKVQDTGAPVITFGAVKRGIVDKTYTLPETLVEDSSKETLTASMKVFELNGTEKGKEMPVTDNAFTPDRMGYYLIEATATDSNGNVGTETATMYAREAPEDNEIVSFKYAEDIECVGWSLKNGSITWEDEFEGETGVAKFSYTGNYWSNAFSVLPLQDVSENSSLYDDYDTLIVRMYIKNDAEYTNYFTETSGKTLIITDDMDDDVKETQKAYESKTKLAYNQWVDFTFNIKAISAWDDEVLDVYYDKLWGYGVKKFDTDGTTEITHKGEFYVAGIFCANKVEVTATANSYAVGNTVTFSTDASDPNATYTLVKPDGTEEKLIGNTYTLEQKGAYTVKVVGDDYYGETTFTATRTYGVTEFMTFDNADDISFAATRTTTGETGELISSLSWEEEYAGETGVLKVHYGTGAYPAVSIKPIQPKVNHSNFSHVVFRLFIPTGTGATNVQINNTASSANHSNVQTTIKEGEWFDCKFAINAFTNWTDDKTAKGLFDGNCRLFLTVSNSQPNTAFYVADVRFEQRVDVTATATADGAFAIVANVNGVAKPLDSASTVKVVSATGVEMTVEANADGEYLFVPTETGTYTVKITGKYVGSTTFNARVIGAKELLSFDYAEDASRAYAGSYTKTNANGDNETVVVPITWLNEYEGEKGVIKIEYDGNANAHKWPAFAFQSYKTQAEIATYSRVVFRVYIPTGTGASKANVHNTGTSQNHSAVDGTATLTEGEWIDIKFSVAAFTNWTDGSTASELFNNKCQFFLTLGEKKASTIYIADISLA